jgi:hypothetical protein
MGRGEAAEEHRVGEALAAGPSILTTARPDVGAGVAQTCASAAAASACAAAASARSASGAGIVGRPR